MLARQTNTTVVMAEVQAIDTGSRAVLKAGANIPYDYLVIATGAPHSYFGHEEWAAFAPGLKSIDDATLTRRRILIAFEQAEVTPNEDEHQRLPTFVIVGGGATGVEMAGAIAEIARQTLAPDFRNIDPRTARILLVEAGPRILPAFPERISTYAEKALGRMGVEVLTFSPVTNCDQRGVEVGGRFVSAGTVVWAAGVVASPPAFWTHAPSDKAGRILVEPDLTVSGYPEIFAIGDSAAVRWGRNRIVPGLAAAAKQMGHYVSRVIAARVRGSDLPGPFRYAHQGDLATIGWRSAVVNLRHLQLTGVLGWMFWSVAHIYFLIGVRSRFVVAFSWAREYLTFQRGARLITGIDKDHPM
jgi:NADH dehydrogenase